MPHIGIRELQRDTSAIVRRVSDGDHLVITRHNRPVAVLIGIADAKQTIRRLHRFKPRERGRIIRAFERWIWCDETRPLNVTIAELMGDRPVREFPAWGGE
jgi:prevent-host-death family protein